MLNPHANVSQITKNDPGLAVPLLDFMLWLATTPDVAKTDEYSEIMESLYSKTPDFTSARNRYVKSRLVA